MAEWLLIGTVAIWAGLINSVVGSGTLVTFPTLVWLGIPPLTANVSNNLGLIPGAFTAYLGTKNQLGKDRHLVRALGPWSLAGGAIGAVLLVLLPERVFRDVVPVVILVGVGLVLAGPRISQSRGLRASVATLAIVVFCTGIYGGYFGAAQGILLLGVLSGIGGVALHEANALKNAFVVLVNGTAGVIFLFSDHIDWLVVLVIALGSSIGAFIGARYGRLIPTNLYRAVIVIVGTAAGAWFLLS